MVLGGILLLLLLVSTIQAENILFLQTIASRSHHIWNREIFNRLYDNGHNLTILTFEKEESVPGKTFLLIENFNEKMMADFAGMDYSATMTPLQNIRNVYDYYSISGRHLVQEQALQRLLQYPRTFKFDLIIHDFTMGQFLLGFVEYFGYPPLVSISAYNIPTYTTMLADIPLNPTYMPHQASGFTERMNFIERCKNTFYWAFEMFYRQQVFMTNENTRMAQLFGGNHFKHVKLLERRSDIILVNSDFSLDHYQPLPPNVIPVGGLHIKRSETMQPMIKQFMARANKGVVLFSFGTNVQSEWLGEEVNRQILEMFKSLPDYNFIWKRSNNDKIIMPTNVLIMPWVPQLAILMSPKTKLLVSHGGLLSMQEAIWHGVPVVSKPFFADQYKNAKTVESLGVGIALDSEVFSVDALRDAMLAILTNSSYQAQVKLRSALFRNQPEAPLDRAIFWIEKVIENKGLRYLRSPAQGMPPYQVYGLDMVGIVLLILLGYYFIIRRHVKKPTVDTKQKKE